MRAMLLEAPRAPLVMRELAAPRPAAGEVLIEVEACAVCRTDLHLVDDELPDIPYPLILGHQVVGRVIANRSAALDTGARVGVPWLGGTCGRCRYCVSARENLCDTPAFTGYTRPGGYAELMTARGDFCFELGPGQTAVDAAPLLCAGLIGYRALGMCGDADRVGLYGFGAAAHQLAQVLRHEAREFYAFTRPGDARTQAAARALGAAWAGASDETAPEPLEAAIVFAPVGALVPAALKAVEPGGTVVCAGIHMSDIPSFPYADLWGERSIRSVANLTRADGRRFLELAAEARIETEVTFYPLEAANEALADLRAGAFMGSAVLNVAPSL